MSFNKNCLVSITCISKPSRNFQYIHLCIYIMTFREKWKQIRLNKHLKNSSYILFMEADFRELSTFCWLVRANFCGNWSHLLHYHVRRFITSLYIKRVKSNMIFSNLYMIFSIVYRLNLRQSLGILWSSEGY